MKTMIHNSGNILLMLVCTVLIRTSALTVNMDSVVDRGLITAPVKLGDLLIIQMSSQTASTGY